ncbi:TolC family protein [Pseudomonas sp. BP8]|uniref:TolC family protein n=1 Tax=Pseudomonas sp. BP8 TaxID=2817864 RepID=UPI001AE18D89|nr:TolC family protein [Pseudomonas sp. BP8]MBP2264172.1 outer membrane protein TolC [Pseudomonas sp. BP8]HDS1736423.1 TolC family protein [Pseudomonas putida]
MNSRTLLFCALGLPAAALAEQALQPVRPTQAGPVSANAVAAAQAAQVQLALSDAIALGLRDNRGIRSAYLERIAQKFDLRVAHDRFAPQLSIKARYQGNRNQGDRYRQGELAPSASLLTPYGTRLSLDWAYDHTRADGAGPRYRDGASLVIIQPLLRGAGPTVAAAPLRQAQWAEQANRLALKDTVAQTITTIITLYRELLRAQEQLRIADDALQRARQFVEVNRALIGAGRMAAFEIVQAEADVASQELALEGSRNQLHASRLALLQALALDLATPLWASEQPQARQVKVDANQALARAEALQPAYLMQVIADQQANLDLRVARDAQRWDLSLVGGASQARERPGDGKAWEHYLGLQLEIPITDLSRRQALIRAQVAVDSGQVQLAESRQQLHREVANAVRVLEVGWRQLEIAERALALSRRKLKIEQEKLAVGRSSNFQVLSFESDLRSAQSAQLDALIAYLNAQSDLDLTLGTTLDSWDVALND